jgi:hypothetical protein
MATNTTKLGLIKPDFVDVVDVADLNTNADDIDAAVGFAIVTSSTRPSSPWAGQAIFETDTGLSFSWDGDSWEAISGGLLSETTEKTAAYTLALGDIGRIVQMNASGAVDVTVPLNSAVAFPVGTVIGVYNRSSNAVTVVGDAGVTVRNAGAVGQFGEASLRKRGTDEWVMVGG